MTARHEKKEYRFLKRFLVVFFLLLPFLFLAGYEIKTNRFEASFFTWYGRDISWHTGRGESSEIAFPSSGPFDLSRGYALMPVFQERLKRQGYAVTSQARQSKKTLLMDRYNIPLPYEKKKDLGLRIRDKNNTEIYRVDLGTHHFPSFRSIPPILVDSLLHIENRELFDMDRPFMNPAVEWDRFFLASLSYAGEKVFGFSGGFGGSTLATQIQKFRHFPMGLTLSPIDKLRQMAGASLWCYRKGRSTVSVRREIVKEYLNEMPLGAAPGYGELNGIGSGMWAWFGKSIGDITADLLLDENDFLLLEKKAKTFKEALSLIISTRHPSAYLQGDHHLLEQNVNRHLNLLAKDGVISYDLKRAAIRVSLRFRQGAPVSPPIPYTERKGTNAIRINLQQMLGLKTLYELDRLDLSAAATFDLDMQKRVNSILSSLYDTQFLKQNGFFAPYLLSGGDPKKVFYSFALFENLPGEGNVLRIQTDTLDQPLNINTGVKLELGSTAKLRTLASYLIAVDQLDGACAGKDRKTLIEMAGQAKDSLSRWVSGYRLTAPGSSREEVLRASLERSFSASSHQPFFTGGGLHFFKNFDKDQDVRFYSVAEAFRQSVNLVFIRIMRELVEYHIARLGYDQNALLSEKENLGRLPLLEEAAEKEALPLLRKYYKTHIQKPHHESLSLLRASTRHPLRNWLLLYLKEHPDADFDEVAADAKRHFHNESMDLEPLRKLFRAYKGKSYRLSDEAYLLGKHPLEVWLVDYLKLYPGAGWKQVEQASREARRESFSWLFKKGVRHAQDLRLRIILEEKAFAQIHRTWKSHGYPFDYLTPSLATAIGSSGDRPISLAELVGIIINDGIAEPMVNITDIHFAERTPYETHFSYAPATSQRVMSPETARVLRYALGQVVEAGTARRIKDTFVTADGMRLEVGGKTGTGDNRYETFSRSAEVISSKITSRTSTFVFYVDRYFGVVTAHVEGPEASQYGFTSALAVQVLKVLYPALQPYFVAKI